ncbi:MAG: hypothetical protein UV63_C0044G0006 [Microgenomates group bacterium GW2011_GWC1_43_11]|uniref:Uncharacterized protein n=2 Tax=Candidatus Gottesmaniibacteriota TaxID=1752720 RepID=A0A0G1IPA7_9BACT|nr:MAG: hypothetical protein UV63_C0044G0006 [Microgenomates group bacterium GW2011_GWC1_43_11]KKT38828.1 MAG: hypothetical protein UW22_C0005G0002 [Candidatus Gottesmanbacteria bacterium GW2011_GWB1_44_11c]KKT61201.1 MAG: hypothetical protein UW52_C0008G0007 [Candidatus Gottesmanbacteria bacterium GW2011_GWA1_44_24b]HCM82016.1 hypothetical protein [Patescibacteria group bacterium]
MQRKFEQEQGEAGVPECPRFQEELHTYLRYGQKDYTYRSGLPHVSEEHVRDLALGAGHTLLALGGLGSGGWTDLRQDKRCPNDPIARFPLIFHIPMFGLRKDVWYDGVRAVRRIVEHQPPDLPEGQDPLRNGVLEKIRQFALLKEQLRQAGKRGFSFGTWSFDWVDTSMSFFLNPFDQEKHSSGRFSLIELEQWLNDDQSCPVLKENQEALRAVAITFDAVKDYPRMYRDDLGLAAARLQADPGDHTNRRLLTIGLMGCPFPDLVEEFSASLK